MKRAIFWGAISGIGGLAVVLAIAAAGSATAPAVEERSPPQRSMPAAAPAAATTPIAAVATLDDVLAAHDPEILIAALDSTDAVVVAEASNALVANNLTSALPALVAFDVIERPWAAPSVIDALGRLAAVAPADRRADVIDRLVALLHQEKRRGAIESQGNVIQIYEALGHTNDSRAIEPLERELDDPGVGTAPKAVVVQSLVALRATRSRGALERLYARLASSAEGLGFEAELRRDLLNVIRDALVRLS